MNKSNLKSYAPKARLDFIKAVTEQAHLLGISPTGTQPAERRGDVLLIDGREWPAKVEGQRNALLARIQRQGFAQAMEEVAYTWFNRFAALRYMEIHDLLGHGWRVLSSRDGGLPELLRHAAELTLPGLSASKVHEMQLAGNRDDELYKQLLVAQCNELSRTMPFLFERIDDDTELLLPDNLLRTDSIIAKLVAGVPEEDWQEIEVIGWLYQFYISEKKDQVIGKVVKSEDIPAATQLFTPNWIVQYLVQNSVGRLWLMANPTSTLASQWPYYIQPAEQTPEVQAQLDALIHTRVAEDGDTLNPETITVLDPACGSGHILVVAYDVLKAIYLERGYRLRDIPRLILEKNLYGLDIDDRAAQLAGFALLMKARADDRRLLADPANPPRLNVLALQNSTGLNAATLASALQPEQTPNGLLASPLHTTVAELLADFEHAKTFGSLIQIGRHRLPVLRSVLSLAELAVQQGDLYAQAAAQDLLPLLRQALVLGMQFDAVVANPPYMGSGYFNERLKSFVNSEYQAGKAEMYACFALRALSFGNSSASIALITIPNWMYLSSFFEFRQALGEESEIVSLIHNGRGVFGSDFGSCAFAIAKGAPALNGIYKKLFTKQGSVSENEELKQRFHENPNFISSSQRHRLIPGNPIAYWASDAVVEAFDCGNPIDTIAKPRVGLQTGDNNKFLRFWYEVSRKKIGTGVKKSEVLTSKDTKWFPYNKGGAFRRWYGNSELIVNWHNDGQEIRNFGAETGGKPRSRAQNTDFYFRPSISWSKVTIGAFSARYFPEGHLFDVAGCSLFPEAANRLGLLGLLNSVVVKPLLSDIAQSVNFEVGQIAAIPLPDSYETVFSRSEQFVETAISISKMDWDDFETSWEFSNHPLVSSTEGNTRLSDSFSDMAHSRIERVGGLREMEQQINSVFINAYGLQDELSPEVPEDQITLARADREKDCQRLISYAIGCMMGRYSLDAPGLIYAYAGNVGFDASRYTTFLADADGILPVTEEHWFADDAPERIREFLLAVWGPDTLEENMAWLAESLGAKAAETPAETIRRYIGTKFFKDHLQTYKKRPIYWLFSSGKQGAFQALVYLHRYNESTLARMRAEYVVPLISKMAGRLDMLAQDVAAAPSAAARTKLQKKIEALRKQHTELLAYDEKLRHYADLRIALDLDDGVKVNYGKFGDLLDSVKVVTGGSGDD